MDALRGYLTRRANQRHSFIIPQSVKIPRARNSALSGVILGENPYPQSNLHWLAAASGRLRVAEPPRRCDLGTVAILADPLNGRSPRHITLRRSDLALPLQRERNRSQQAMIAWQQRAGPAEHRWSGSGLPCDHGRTSCRARAANRYAAMGGARDIDSEHFFVEAALGRFARCRYSAIKNNVQTNTYDPR